MKLFTRKFTLSRFVAALVVSQALCCAGQSYAGSLTGTVVHSALHVNLTLKGTTDWAVWGQGANNSLAPSDHRLGGSGISDLTDISEGDPLRGLGQFNSYGESIFDWTNGTNTSVASNVYSGLQHNDNISGGNQNPVGEGFSFTVPASLNLQEVTLYFTVNNNPTDLTATLSDGSAPMFENIFTPSSANSAGILTIDFTANSPGQTLTIAGVLVSGSNSANFAVQGVTLAAVVPEPATYAELMLGLIGLVLVVRRRKATA